MSCGGLCSHTTGLHSLPPLVHFFFFGFHFLFFLPTEPLVFTADAPLHIGQACQ